MIRIGSIVLRVDDLPRQKAFWTAALDYAPRDGDGDDFALLRPKDGAGPNVSLDRVRSTGRYRRASTSTSTPRTRRGR
jgi:hypothetical protein